MRSASNLSLEAKTVRCAELYASGLSTRDIAAAVGIGKSSVATYVNAAGLQMDGPARISAKRRGQPSNRKGACQTAEARAKISAARAGVPTTLGQTRTPEQRARMSVAQRRVGRLRKLIRSQFALFRRTPVPKMTADERDARRKVRAAAKQMLARVLKMARRRKDAKTEQMLGYTKIQLREHLEAQFRPGMSWANRCSFEIDHIVPVAEFFRRGVFDPVVINALSNLQPLTPQENRTKRDRVITITDQGAQLGVQELT